MITIKLRRGTGIPTTAQLNEFEMGWSTNNKKLYINDGGAIRLAGGGGLLIGLNGLAPTDEGTVSFYAPTTIAGMAGRVVKLKATITAGEDPFEFLAIATSPVSGSGSLITSGGVYTALQGKVNVNGTDRLMTAAEGTKLAGIQAGAQVNVIETVQVDGVALTIAGKTVNITGKENITNKVTAFSSPTDTQYPSAKLVNDELAKKLTMAVTSGGTSTLFENLGNTATIRHQVTSGNAVNLHFQSGKVYLPKYTTGNAPQMNDETELLNRAEVRAMITGDASRLITSRKGTAGDYSYEAFDTAEGLLDGPWYSQGTALVASQLNDGDYAYVRDDENHGEKQTMYVWDGTSWTFAIEFAEDPLIPDNVTLEAFGGTGIRVKASGIAAAQIASNAVTTAKIANNNVTIAKLVGTVGSGDGRIIGYNAANVANVININNNVANVTALFAPVTGGTSGQILRSNGNAAPTWMNMPVIPTITLNGSTTTTPSFYAPTTGGTSGQVLMSNGSSAPGWTGILDGGTW